MGICKLENLSEQCQRVLEKIWSSKISQKKIKMGKRCEEDLNQGIIYYSEKEMKEWGDSIAREAGERNGAGKCLVIGHSLSHFFAINLNRNMYEKGVFDTPSSGHRLRVEAIVDVSTKWMLDKMGYNGKRMMEIRQTKLKKIYGDALDTYLKVYDNFVEKAPEHLKKYVADYSILF